jgi:hypothetical protein
MFRYTTRRELRKQIYQLKKENIRLQNQMKNAHRVLVEEMKWLVSIPTIELPDHYLQIQQAIDFLDGKDV